MAEENISIDISEPHELRTLVNNVRGETEPMPNEAKKKLNGFQLYMHEQHNQLQEPDFGALSRSCKVKWRAMSSDQREAYNTAGQEGITLPDPCPKCGTQYAVRKRQNEHNNSCGKFKCRFCEKEFASKKNLVPHEKKHEREFVCTTCDKSFESVSKLSRHMVVHDKSRSVTCDKCGKSFSRRDTLIKHQKKNHTE